MAYRVAAFYQFAALPDFRALRETLRALCAGLGLKGSVLLAHEGINGTLAGSDDGIAAFVDALRSGLGVELDVVDYAEHALGQGADASAAAYVETVDGAGALRWGVGTHPNIITASLRAVLSALGRRPR